MVLIYIIPPQLCVFNPIPYYLLSGYYDVIIFDVDSKDLTLGMSCPAPSFVEEEVLAVTKDLLSSGGRCECVGA